MSEASRRLDVELVRRGLARSRGQARELIDSGLVLHDGRVVGKPALPVPDLDVPVQRLARHRVEQVQGLVHRGVSRGLPVRGPRLRGLGLGFGLALLARDCLVQPGHGGVTRGRAGRRVDPRPPVVHVLRRAVRCRGERRRLRCRARGGRSRPGGARHPRTRHRGSGAGFRGERLLAHAMPSALVDGVGPDPVEEASAPGETCSGVCAEALAPVAAVFLGAVFLAAVFAVVLVAAFSAVVLVTAFSAVVRGDAVLASAVLVTAAFFAATSFAAPSAAGVTAAFVAAF